VLIYGAIRSPLAQPRNALGGHLISALVGVVGDKKIHDLGYLYVLMPVSAGIAVMLLVALLVNNIPGNRQYPEYWL